MNLNSFLRSMHQLAGSRLQTSIVDIDTDLEEVYCNQNQLSAALHDLFEEQLRAGVRICLAGSSHLDTDDCDEAAARWLAEGVYAVLSLHFAQNTASASAGIEHLPRPNELDISPAAAKLSAFAATNGGLLTLQTVGGSDATWRLYLRCESRSKQAIDVEDSLAAETVLLVEDEDFVRSVTREVLEMSGYCVLEARNAAEGIKIFKESSAHVDLLLTDVVMPGMNGPELVRNLTAIAPTLRVLFMSGYGHNRVAHLHAQHVSRELRAFENQVRRQSNQHADAQLARRNLHNLPRTRDRNLRPVRGIQQQRQRERQPSLHSHGDSHASEEWREHQQSGNARPQQQCTRCDLAQVDQALLTAPTN